MSDVDAAREALLAEAAENGVWLEFTAALAAFEAAIRAEGLDDDERTSIYDSAWLQGYEKARAEAIEAAIRAEGLDVERHDIGDSCECYWRGRRDGLDGETLARAAYAYFGFSARSMSDAIAAEYARLAKDAEQ